MFVTGLVSPACSPFKYVCIPKFWGFLFPALPQVGFRQEHGVL